MATLLKMLELPRINDIDHLSDETKELNDTHTLLKKQIRKMSYPKQRRVSRRRVWK